MTREVWSGTTASNKRTSSTATRTPTTSQLQPALHSTASSQDIRNAKTPSMSNAFSTKTLVHPHHLLPTPPTSTGSVSTAPFYPLRQHVQPSPLPLPKYSDCQPNGGTLTGGNGRSMEKNGASIEDYEVGDLLGSGGFGYVYKAYSKSGDHGGKAVAVKMIDKQKMNAENLRRRVANEVEIHSQLRHSSILELYNYFEDSEHVCLVMELCTGGELYRYLQQRRQPLSEGETRNVMIQLVEGLLYLHSHGILHRDLKLSNILLTDKLELKIADFGLAARINTTPNGEQKTMCGTPNYISPEIISRQPYGLAADVWSLGCMFVTFLTGKPPFESQKVKSTLDKVSRAEYTLPDTLSLEAKDLTHRLLQIDPKKRLSLDRILKHRFFDPSYPVEKLRLLGDVSGNTRGNKILKEAGNEKDHQRYDGHPNGNYELETRRREQTSRESRHGPIASNKENQPPQPPQSRSEPKNPLKSTFAPPPPSSSSNTSTSRLHAQVKPSSQAPTSNRSENELVPFSTARLKAIRQQTRHGVVEILSRRISAADGKELEGADVLLDFAGDERIMAISGDGQTITFYNRDFQTSSAENGRQGTFGFEQGNRRAVRKYGLDDLPARFVKKYRYASKFVHLVRSKTPKIIFYSPQAKCILMENGPAADFEMVFYNGIKVHNSVAHSRLEIRIPPTCSASKEIVHAFDTTTRKQLEGLSPELIPVIKHVQECLRMCVDVEKSGKVEENARNGGSWPLILKSGVSGNGNWDGDLARTEDGSAAVASESRHHPLHYPSPGSIHPSTMSNYSTDQRGNVGIQMGNSEGTGNGKREGATGSAREDPWNLHRPRIGSANVARGGNNYVGVSGGKTRSLPSVTPISTGQRTSTQGLSSHVGYSHSQNLPPFSRSTQSENDALGFSSTQRSRTDQYASGSTLTPARPSSSSSCRTSGLTKSVHAPPVASSTSSAGSVGLRSGGGSTYVFLDGIGWCVKNTRETDGVFTMMFLDGVRVIVEVKRQILVWIEHGGETTTTTTTTGGGGGVSYPIDKFLPPFVKAKLAHFPGFVKRFEEEAR